MFSHVTKFVDYFRLFSINKRLLNALEEEREQNQFLEDQIAELSDQLNEQKVTLESPQHHLKYIFDEGIPWYDADELTEDERKTYGSYAESLLKNPVFKNEINFLITNLTKRSFLETTDFRGVELNRIGALVLTELKTRVEELVIVTEPVETMTEEEKFEAN